jgi:hypothetical protein
MVKETKFFRKQAAKAERMAQAAPDPRSLRPRGTCSFLRPGIVYPLPGWGSNEAKATT